MPKDEFDFDDPLELNCVALETSEDTQRAMAECFIEEFLMLGYNPGQLLALFRNPHYIGMNMVLRDKGEGFVKELVSEVCARWGGRPEWPEDPTASPTAESANESRVASADADPGENPIDPAGHPLSQPTP
jgi:hypothetical protein